MKTYFCFLIIACLFLISQVTLSQNVTVMQAGSPIVFPGAVNQPILRILISTSIPATGISNFNFNTNGSSNPLFDIATAKLYYSGSDSVFNTMTVQLTGTFFNPWLTNFSINPSIQNLNIGDHYFWLTFDVAATALVCDSLDAEFLSLNFNNVPYAVNNPAPPGFSVIGPCNTSVLDLNMTRNLMLYPNPASDEINLKSDLTSIELLSVYNISGELIMESRAVSSNSCTIDVSNLTPGMYLMRVVSGSDTYQEKFQIITD